MYCDTVIIFFSSVYTSVFQGCIQLIFSLVIQNYQDMVNMESPRSMDTSKLRIFGQISSKYRGEKIPFSKSPNLCTGSR